jgi:hypothetical protein
MTAQPRPTTPSRHCATARPPYIPIGIYRGGYAAQPVQSGPSVRNLAQPCDTLKYAGYAPLVLSYEPVKINVWRELLAQFLFLAGLVVLACWWVALP